MRCCGAGLIAALLALAGCKATDSKTAGPKEPARTKELQKTRGTGPEWLEGSLAKIPGAGTSVPRADSWAKPGEPGFNVANEVKGVLAGRVLDPLGHGAKGVYIRIEPVSSGPTGTKEQAAIGILADGSGYFMAKGLKPGQTYLLTAEASAEGKSLYGVVQARTPQSNLTIALRADLSPPGPELPGSVKPSGRELPPPLVPSTSVTTGALPPPDTDLIPAPAAPVRTRPADGSWAPDPGGAVRPIPATLAPSTNRTAPPAPPLPESKEPAADAPARPENQATGPAVRPPVLNIPGPPVPPLPSSVPPLPRMPAPITPGTGKQSSRPSRPLVNFALVDTLERPWDFASNREGSLVLVDFMTTTCAPCKRALPILVDLQSRYAADGLQLVGVVCDDVPQRERAAMAAKYQRDHNLNYALYVEPGSEPGAVRDRFQVESYPTLILFNREGRIVWKGHPAEKGALESAIRRELGR